MSIEEFFIAHARLSRRTLARFAEIDPSKVNRAAKDLGFGELLRLDEAEEILTELEEDDDAPDDGEDEDDVDEQEAE